MKTKTGIKGFDELLGGGFPVGKSILVSGTPGTGKTIFGLQYLYNGAVKFKEKGLYVSFEEGRKSLRSQAKMFGWDLEKEEKNGMIKILEIAPEDIKETTAEDIMERIAEEGHTRLVIDSLSALAINVPTTVAAPTDLTEISIKRFLYSFINKLRKTEVTALLVTQTSNGHLSMEGVSEFVADGIVQIVFESLGGNYNRNLVVRKMRETDNDEDLHPVEIGKAGIVVHNLV